MVDQSISSKIIALKDADFKLRDQLIQEGKLGKGYDADMEDLHNRNAKTLNKIIDEIGYPTIDKVGEEANKAAWLIIQHAIGQPDFMRRCAALLEDAVKANQADPIQLVYLKDRIAVFEGKPQWYGSQFDWDEEGVLNPQPYDDLAKVNARRKTLGLNTLEEQTTIMRRRAAEENQWPPTDFKERKMAYEQWLKKVGWVI